MPIPEKRRQKDRDSYKRHVEKRKQKSQNWRERIPRGLRNTRKNIPRHIQTITALLFTSAKLAKPPFQSMTLRLRMACPVQSRGYRCCYCGKKFPSTKLQPDHLTPYAKQGQHFTQCFAVLRLL